MTSRALTRAAVLALGPALALCAACTSSDGGGASSGPLPATGSPTGSAPASTAQTVPAPSSSTSRKVQRPTSTPTTPIRTTTAPTGPQSSQTTKKPVPISSSVAFVPRVTGRITGIRSVTVKSVQPGEIGGPALAVTITVRNDSGRSIALDDAVVNLAYGPDKTPGSTLSGPPSKPFQGSLATGRSVSGTYTFRVPRENQNDLLTVDVSYSPNAPAVVFSGRR